VCRPPAWWAFLEKETTPLDLHEVRATLAEREMAVTIDPELWQVELVRAFPEASARFIDVALHCYMLLAHRGAWHLTERQLAETSRTSKTYARNVMFQLAEANLIAVERPDICRKTADGPRNLPNTVWLLTGEAPLPPFLTWMATLYRLLTAGLGVSKRWAAQLVKAGKVRAQEAARIIVRNSDRVKRLTSDQGNGAFGAVSRGLSSVRQVALDLFSGGAERLDSLGSDRKPVGLTGTRSVIGSVVEPVHAVEKSRGPDRSRLAAAVDNPVDNAEPALPAVPRAASSPDDPYHDLVGRPTPRRRVPSSGTSSRTGKPQ